VTEPPEILRCRADTPPASDLVDAMVAELIPLYGRIDVPGAPTASPDEMAPPGGSFLVLVEDGRPVAGGGLKRLDVQTCEIKRMFVVADARGRGLAGVLLRALEDEARSLGYVVARLDTGPKQPHAQRMYEHAGYRPIGNFNANPFASFWGEKAL
jgi:GNAT superfamily N-acetyltransferase